MTKEAEGMLQKMKYKTIKCKLLKVILSENSDHIIGEDVKITTNDKTQLVSTFLIQTTNQSG